MGVSAPGSAVREDPRRDAASATRLVELIEVDWKGLGRSLLPFVLALGLSVTMIGGTNHYRGAEELRLEDRTRQLREFRDRFRSIDDEERLIEELLPRFRTLEAQGIIGPEARLDWVETLRAASRRLTLPELRYALGTQESLPAGTSVEAAEFGVHRSLMELDLGLLHEGDLSRLFDMMERESRGLFTVTSCRIRRVGPHFVHLPDAVNLRAVCVLEWISLRESEAGP